MGKNLRRRDKHSVGPTRRLEPRTDEAQKRSENVQQHNEYAEQKCMQEERKPEVRDKPESSRRRKRGSRGKAQTMPELKVKAVVVSSDGPKTVHSTKAPSSNPRRKDGERKSICRFLVGISEDSEFQVCRRLIGPGGENMKRITAEAPEAKIRIRGTGSKYLEGPDHEESRDPLMICVSASSQRDFEIAVSRIETLLATVQTDYRNFCKSRRLPVPVLAVHREDMRVDAVA